MILFHLMVNKKKTTTIFFFLKINYLDPPNHINSNDYCTPQSIEHSTSYVNELNLSNHSDIDDFYVMPRQEDLPLCDTHNPLTNSSENTYPTDSNPIYVAPPTFSKNFVVESNLSFDDSQDIPNISLDSVPDLISNIPTDNNIYYSYPEQQSIIVNKYFLNFDF